MPDPLPNREGRIGSGDLAYNGELARLFTSFIAERLVISRLHCCFFGRVECISQWRKREKKAHKIFQAIDSKILSSFNFHPTCMMSIFCITHLCAVAKATPEELRVELKSYVVEVLFCLRSFSDWPLVQLHK